MRDNCSAAPRLQHCVEITSVSFTVSAVLSRSRLGLEGNCLGLVLVSADSENKCLCLVSVSNTNCLVSVSSRLKLSRTQPSPSIENTVTIKNTQDGLSLRLLSLIHISIPKVYILGLFYCHSCLLNRLDILIQLIHKCLTFNIIHPHLKALLNNIFTSKSLTCMALDAITVFGKV